MNTKLAVIGDSLSQGFQDGAVGPDFVLRSFPAIIAHTLGLSLGSGKQFGFRVPSIAGEGLPLDIVALLKRVEQRTGPDISRLEWAFKGLPAIAAYLDQVEDYYERGPGRAAKGPRDIPHNLAAYGLTVFESMHLTSEACDQMIAADDGWFKDDVFGTPSGAKYRAAKMVLNPDGSRPRASQLDNLDYLINGKPELELVPDPPRALLVWLGANDCLGTVVELELRDMQGSAAPDLSLQGRRAYNLTSAKQFRTDYEALATRLDQIIGAREIDVFVGTVPDISIPPISKGLGELRNDVFDYYVRFFTPGDAKPPLFHKRLVRAEVEQIQARIRGFNDVIRSLVAARGKRWHVVEIGAVLEQLAVRRNRKRPEEPLRDYYAAKGRPDHPLLQLTPTPNLMTLRCDESGSRIGGGLTGLDGVHPTTIGYGIAAEVFLEAMQQHGVPDTNALAIDWDKVIASDRLAQRAPATWDDFLDAAQENSLLWDTLFRTLSTRM